MAHALSRVAGDGEQHFSNKQALAKSQRSSDAVVDIAIKQVKSKATGAVLPDRLLRLPLEIRNMIWEHLLAVPGRIFRGADHFVPLHPSEYEKGTAATVHWQIILTCRRYYEEAFAYLYENKHFVFCTGTSGAPGMFKDFPINTSYLSALTSVDLYIEPISPDAETSIRVAHFMKAMRKFSGGLENLTILFATYQPWHKLTVYDIVGGDHPVGKEIVSMIEEKTVRNMKIRLHDSAVLSVYFAHYLRQTWEQVGGCEDRTLVFTVSRSCNPPDFCGLTDPCLPLHPCAVCCSPEYEAVQERVEMTIDNLHMIEADEERTMRMQGNILELGLLDHPEVSGVGDEDFDRTVLEHINRPPIRSVYQAHVPRN